MMEAIKNWLCAVVVLSMFLSIAQELIPEGTLRHIAAVTGGLLLCVVLLEPLTHLNLVDFQLEYDAYAEEIAQRQAELEGENDDALTQRIAEKTETYIEDKAESLGITCTAQVNNKVGVDGVPRPYRAELSCGPSDKLAEYMSEELGIPRERQEFHGT